MLQAAIRTSETRYFVDPSIATAALGLGPKDLLNDLKTFGFFFENMAVRDLRVFAEAMNGIVYHYRDSNGLECDAVIHLRDGSYALVEIKLGGQQNIEAGAKSILAIEKSHLTVERLEALQERYETLKFAGIDEKVNELRIKKEEVDRIFF